MSRSAADNGMRPALRPGFALLMVLMLLMLSSALVVGAAQASTQAARAARSDRLLAELDLLSDSLASDWRGAMPAGVDSMVVGAEIALPPLVLHAGTFTVSRRLRRLTPDLRIYLLAITAGQTTSADARRNVAVLLTGAIDLTGRSAGRRPGQWSVLETF